MLSPDKKSLTKVEVWDGAFSWWRNHSFPTILSLTSSKCPCRPFDSWSCYSPEIHDVLGHPENTVVFFFEKVDGPNKIKFTLKDK
jgi:hypothetical protein